MKCLCRCLLLCVSLLAGLAGQAQTPAEEHVGRVIDWSYHHIVASGPISNRSLDRARQEPRILFHLAERNLPVASESFKPQTVNSVNPGRGQFRPEPIRGRKHPGFPPKNHNVLARDWSVSLGAGTVAPNMFPAKFGFNPDSSVTLTNCSTDYVVLRT